MTSPPPPPWHYRLAKRLIRSGMRGPGAWLRLAARRGWLPELARLPVDARLAVDLPLRRREYWWDAAEILAYETALLDAVAERVAECERPLTLVDCGADIGLFPALLAWRGVACDLVVAVEPNADSLAALRSNLAQLDCTFEVCRGAVADFAGRGRLEQPDYDASAHARYLVPDDAGEVPVLTVDSLELPCDGTLLWKLDLEGGELAALRGGAEKFRAAPHVLAIVEAHRQVCQRTGEDPLECVRFLQSQRGCRVQLAERPELEIDIARPLFEQVEGLAIGNLLIETQ